MDHNFFLSFLRFFTFLYFYQLQSVQSKGHSTHSPNHSGVHRVGKHPATPGYSQSYLERMRATHWVNSEEVAAQVGFSDPETNPYPGRKWYNVDIDYNKNCYLRFLDSNHTHYEMITADPDSPPATLPSGGNVFFTHVGPCGVCSSLKDLAVYLESPDLTNPVRSCTMKFIPKYVKRCMKEIGFSKHCTDIWYWNTKNTGAMSPLGGCFGICIANLFSELNEPVGILNPCEPEPAQLLNVDLPAYYEDKNYKFHHPRPNVVRPENAERTMREVARISLEHGIDPHLESEDFREIQPALDTQGQVAAHGHARFCLPSCEPLVKGDFIFDRKRQARGRCGNTINHQPACHPDQYRNNQYRLNPCLQCDECRSGPMFKKVAGRTRRGSGIKTAIDRPGVPKMDHHYFGSAEEFEQRFGNAYGDPIGSDHTL